MADNLQLGIDIALNVASINQTLGRLEQLLLSSLKTNNRVADSFEAVQRAATEAGTAFTTVQTQARRAGQSLGDVGDRTEALQADFRALEARADAAARALKESGADPNLYKVAEIQLRKILDLQARFDRDLADGVLDQRAIRKYEAYFGSLRSTFNKEISGLNQLLRTFTRVTEGQRGELRAVRKSADARDLQDQRSAHGRQIAELQTFGANQVAELKTQSAESIQASRRTARVRLELLRFTLRQAQALERSIGRVFSASAAIIAGGFARIERTVFRIGGIFRRSNRNINDGLQPALLTRERLIDRSFSRQTRTIRSETTRQERVIQQFEARASRGVAGVVTGRSALGSLLGGGLAVGGGFALFQGLRQGFEVGGDFVQGLAVLGAQLQLTQEQIAGVRQQAIDLGNDISLPGVSALDAAEAISLLAKQFGSLGKAALPAAQDAARGVLQLSRATNSSAEAAAQLVGAAVNTFGVEASKAVEVADKVTAALTKAAGVTFDDFRQSFQQSAAVFSLFQVPAVGAEQAVSELNAALAILAKGGLVGSDAGTSLKQFFLQANRGTDDAKEKLAEVAERAGVVGSVFFDQAGNARALSDAVGILRTGLEGLTDEAQTQTLTKIFGSDATRAGAILIRETAEDYDALIKAQDRLNAAQEIAAAQNVGLRGALDALGSVIETRQIKTYEKYQAVLGRVVLKFSEMLDTFFEGEGRIELFRRALTGLAVALGSLLIIKGVSEAFGFFGLSLSTIISPVGLVVAGIGALGAAVAVLLKTSPDFRRALSQIGDVLSSAVVPVLRFAADLLSAFATVLNREVAPAITRFAVDTAGRLRSAVRQLVAFLENSALPAIVGFGGALATLAGPVVRSAFSYLERVVAPVLSVISAFVRDVAVPAFNDLADGLDSRLSPALDRVGEFAGFLRDNLLPLISPAVTAFQNLGEAIGKAFEGDFSELAEGFQGLPGGILQSFANIGEAIVDVVGPQVRRALSFIVSQFDVDSLLPIVATFGRIAKGIGEALGQVVSSPEFLGAIAAIAATAGFLALRFIEGFARGLAEGFPRTLKVIKDELGPFGEDLLKSAFDPVVIAKIIAAAFVAASIGGVLFQTLRRPADQTGKKVGDGFVRGFTGRVRASFRRNDFASGFFGGAAGLERAARDVANRTARAFTREQQRAGERLSVLGLRPERKANDFRVRLPTKDVEKLEKQFGRAALAGVEMRNRINLAFGEINKAAFGVGQVMQGEFRNGFRTIGTAAQGFGKQIAGILRATATNLREVGIGIGQAVGGAIVSGVGAALSGKQLGGADSFGGQALGLAGIISSALFGAAAVGGGPQGVLVGGAIASIGLVTAAFANSGKAAEEAKAKVEAYKGIIEEFGSITAGAADAVDILTDAIIESVPQAAELFGKDGLGLVADDIVDLFDNGRVTVREFFAEIKRNNASLADVDLFGAIDPDILNSDIRDVADNVGFMFGALDNVVAVLEAEGINADGLVELFEALAREADAIATATGEADLSNLIKRGGQALGLAEDQTRAWSLVQDSINNAEVGVDNYVRSATRGAAPVLDILGSYATDAGRVALTVDDVATAFDNLRDRQLGRREGLLSDLAELTSKLEGLQTETGLAREAMFDYLNGDYIDSAQQALARASSGISGTVSSAVEQIQAADVTPAAAKLALDNLAFEFGETAKGVLKAVFANNPDLDPQVTFDLARTELATLETVLQEEVDKQISEIQARVGVEGGITQAEADALKEDVRLAQQILSDELKGLLDQEAFTASILEIEVLEEAASEVQEQIDALDLELALPITFDPEQIKAELRRIFPGLELPSDFAIASSLSAGRISQVPPGVFNESGELVQAQAAARQIPVTEPVFARADTVRQETPTVTMYNTWNVSSPAPRAAGSEANRLLQEAASYGKYTGTSSARVAAPPPSSALAAERRN